MKKLMITSALAGLLVGGNAIAQTTITGEIRVSLKSSGSEAIGGTTTSGRGFGVEQQINFANINHIFIDDIVKFKNFFATQISYFARNIEFSHSQFFRIFSSPRSLQENGMVFLWKSALATGKD